MGPTCCWAANKEEPGLGRKERSGWAALGSSGEEKKMAVGANRVTGRKDFFLS